MGVERKDYIVLGANVKDYINRNALREDEKYLPYLEGHYNVEFRMISSCYNDDYVIAGKVLGEYDSYDGIPITRLSNLEIGLEDDSKVKDFLSEFDKYLEPQLIVFTHWY